MADRKASEDSVILAEYRLLNALIKNKAFRTDARVSEEVFVHEIAKSMYQAIMHLDELGTRVTPQSLLQEGYAIDCNTSEATVNAIFKVDSEGPSEIEDIMLVLKNAEAKEKLIKRLDEVKDKLREPGMLNSEDLLKDLYEIDETLENQSKNDSPILDFKEWADIYIKDLEERKLGRKYSFGDPLLDEELFRGAAPGCITIIGASTNMGKSTYVLSLMDNLLEMNQPCLYISLEMGTIDTMDRLIAKRCEIDNPELYNVESLDGVIDRVKEEQANLEGRKNFYFCRATGVDINKLRTLIKQFKQKTKQNYCLVAIDLLSSMKGFMNSNNRNSSTASAIEVSMNKLEDLAIEENVHIIGVVQFNRDSDNAKVHAIEEIDFLRPTLSSIKNSNAYAEKATTVLSLFRKKYYADRYCPDDPATEDMDDIMEVQILKDRSSQSGTILNYKFDGRHFKLLPVFDEEEVKINKLKEQLENLDY